MEASTTLCLARALRTIALASALPLAACGSTQRPDGGAGMLPEGAAAPDLTAVDQAGKTHKLSEERGHPVVVYFYPKDATPGCTKEACAFRDAWERYQKAGVQVFGVSADDQKSHEQFAKEQSLPFPILSDTDKLWIAGFGVATRLGMATRVSFLLDKDGKVVKVYPDVDPGVHADAVLKDALALSK
jgi:thioredoxin-dependent peroxiredoxin